MKKYIGGEFSYDKIIFSKTSQKNNFKELNWINSGRAAFYNILKKYKEDSFKKIYLPAYICDSLICPVKKVGLKILFYDLDENLNIKNEFQDNSIILLIHFFGKKIKNIDKIKKDIPKNSKIIEDFTHVFLNRGLFDKKISNNFFFSLRKHFGFISGAYSYENYKKIKMNKNFFNVYNRSVNILNFKFEYLNDSNNYDLKKEKIYLDLIKKYEGIINSNYRNYKIPTKINNFNNNISFERVRKKRIQNWNALNQLLKNKVECFHSYFERDEAPFGFVIKVKNRDMVKKKLKNSDIFAPVHWQWHKMVNKKKFPKLFKLSKCILTLPIDHRYDLQSMEILAEKLKRII